MPDEPQGQQYDTSQLDEVQHPTLGPLKFPKAMPPEERNASIDRMLKAQPAQSKTPENSEESKPGFFERASKFISSRLQPPEPGSYSGPEYLRNANPSEYRNPRTGSVASRFEPTADAAKVLEEQETGNLANVAKTGKQLPHAGFNRSALDALKSVSGMAESATSPKSVGLGLGLATVPEIVGPAMVAHGSYEGIKHAPGALKGNPEEAEKSLSGFSEAAGGGAATTGAFEGGIGDTNLARLSKTAVRSARETV